MGFEGLGPREMNEGESIEGLPDVSEIEGTSRDEDKYPDLSDIPEMTIEELEAESAESSGKEEPKLQQRNEIGLKDVPEIPDIPEMTIEEWEAREGKVETAEGLTSMVEREAKAADEVLNFSDGVLSDAEAYLADIPVSDEISIDFQDERRELENLRTKLNEIKGEETITSLGEDTAASDETAGGQNISDRKKKFEEAHERLIDLGIDLESSSETSQPDEVASIGHEQRHKLYPQWEEWMRDREDKHNRFWEQVETDFQRRYGHVLGSEGEHGMGDAGVESGVQAESEDEYAGALRTLGGDENTDIKDLESKYKNLVRQYHPDSNPEGAEKMKEINEAMEKIRKRYGNL